jgi:hypothetical protein
MSASASSELRVGCDLGDHEELRGGCGVGDREELRVGCAASDRAELHIGCDVGEDALRGVLLDDEELQVEAVSDTIDVGTDEGRTGSGSVGNAGVLMLGAVFSAMVNLALWNESGVSCTLSKTAMNSSKKSGCLKDSRTWSNTSSWTEGVLPDLVSR